MKKILALTLALLMALTLAACDGGGGNTTPPANNNPTNTPAGNTQSGGDTFIATIGDGTGAYEGTTDTNGKFTGWGVWIYHNFRYEGYFVDGVPNGEGTLYQATNRDPSVVIVQGQWVDGLGNGSITLTDVHNGFTNVFTFNVQNGETTKSEEIEGVCSGPNVAEQPAYLSVGLGELRAAVPPWNGAVGLDSTIPAPAGSGTNTPPISTTPGTTTPDTTPPPSVGIPNNGTPPNVSAPLESHAGDKGYFYVDTDDYVVWALNYTDNTHILYDTVYTVVSFDVNGNITKAFNKYIFANEADAKTYINDVFSYFDRTQIDNIVYEDVSGGAFQFFWDKESWLNYMQASAGSTSGLIGYYASKP